MRHLYLSVGALLFLIALAAPVHAGIIVEAHYHLGEFDPGASPGESGNATTIDSSGNNHDLTKTGTANYATGSSSSLAMNFISGYYSKPVFFTATNNFGIEARFKADNGSPASVIAYNGNSGFNGYGLYFHYVGATPSIRALYGNVPSALSVPVTVGTWNHVALVRDGGVNTLYVNGVSYSGLTGTPHAVEGRFMIGGNHNYPAERFSGAIDSVRLFQTTGGFAFDDLAEAPEPATLALGLTGLLAFIATRRLRRV